MTMRGPDGEGFLAPDKGAGKAGGSSKPDKVRIYQIAKEYSVSSEAMLNVVRSLGVEAKSHMSSSGA
jgi:hypothetical protein